MTYVEEMDEMMLEHEIDDLMDYSRRIAEVAESESDKANRMDTKYLADYYKQLADWLRELQERRKQPEIIRCGECLHYKPMSSNWGKCGVHSSPTEKYRTCQICDYCSWAERKIDEHGNNG